MTDYLHALPLGYRIEEYELVRVLGSGGFGITYLGYDHHLDKAVAIKEYLPNDLAVRTDNNSVLPKSTQDQADYEWGLARFLNEAQTLARFDHQHIIKIHRFFRAHGTGYSVMEYAEGETLSEMLQRKGTLTESELKQLLFPILDGLEAVHEADFLHRDIKPGNIVIRDDGSPVLIDFGSARQAVAGKSRSVTAIVTPGYAPIEQYSVKGHQGPWTDIYGLGAVCYRCLTGEAPDDATERLREDPLVPISKRCEGKANTSLLNAIDWALRVDEGERPQSIKVWRSELEGSNDTSDRSISEHRDTAVAKADEQGGFKNPAGLMKWTKLFLLAHVVMAIIAIMSGRLEYQLLTDFKNEIYTSQELAAEAAETSDLRQGIVGVIQTGIFVISGILILMWIYRANYNARQLGASDMNFTPGWSVGWYFIPIANLWKPYQAMKEIWKASSSPQNWSGQPVSSLLPWWWFLWIINNILGHVSFRLATGAEELSEFLTANVVTQFFDATLILLSLILITIVRRVHDMQMSHAKAEVPPYRWRKDTSEPPTRPVSPRPQGSRTSLFAKLLLAGVLLALVLYWWGQNESQAPPISSDFSLLKEPKPESDPERTTAFDAYWNDDQPAKAPALTQWSQLTLDIQKILMELGYNPGIVDGIYGERTKVAIEAFQQDIGIPVDGQISRQLLHTLSQELVTRQGETARITDTAPTQKSPSIFTGFQEEYFTRGSHEDDVLRLQGTPSSIDRVSSYEIWRFGISSVKIDLPTRRVLEWSNIEGNLKVRLLPGNQVTSEAYFTRDSHQDDVLRLQGTPSSIDRFSSYEIWRFGISNVKIDLQARRVLEWSNIEGNLKVRLLPGNQVTSEAYFTRDSHQDDVLRLQGTPSSIDRFSSYEIWRFGISNVKIDLQTRRVLEWNNVEGNLKVKL